MKNVPTYDSNVTKRHDNTFGKKQWTKLASDCPGALLYHVQMDVFRCYVHKDASVPELGAGAGMFSKELVTLAGQLVVSDISEEQLAINRSKLTELGLENHIADFLILDITDLKSIANDQYNTVRFVGGALNYTFENAASSSLSEKVLRQISQAAEYGYLLTADWRHACRRQLNPNKVN